MKEIQQSRFLSLVSNVDEYKNALAIAQNAEGAGELQTLKTLDSLESKLERLKVTIQEFYTSSGLEALYKNIVDIITNVVGAMNSLPKIGEKFPAAALSIGLGVIGNIKTILTLLVNSITKVFDEIQNKHKQMTERIVDQARQGAREARNAVEEETNKDNGLTRKQQQEARKLSRKEKLRQGLQVTGMALNAADIYLNGTALNQYGSSTNVDQDRAAGTKMMIGTIAGIGGDVVNVIAQALSGNYFGAITTGITGLTKAVSGITSGWQMLNPTLERTAELEEKRLQQLHEETVLAKGNVNDLQQAITKLKQLEKQQYSSNEAMKEYIDYRSQVAEQFPQLISEYDNEGNAVINLAEDYLTLNDAILTALKAEAAETKQKAITLESQRKAANEGFGSDPVYDHDSLRFNKTGHYFREYENELTFDEIYRLLSYGISLRDLNFGNTANNVSKSGTIGTGFLGAALFNKKNFIEGLRDTSENGGQRFIRDFFVDDDTLKAFILGQFKIFSEDFNLDNLAPDLKGKIQQIKEATSIDMMLELLVQSYDVLEQANNDYYQSQIDGANLAAERINTQVQLQEQMNQSYPEKASLLYLDKTLNGLVKDIINTAIVQDDNGKITYGNYDTANEFYEKLDEQTNEFLSYYASLSDRQQQIISDIISNRKNYTTQDKYIQALRQVGITNDFFLQYLGKSWNNLSNEIQNNLDGAKSQFETRLKNIKRATLLSSKLSDLTTIQDFPLVLQSTLINSIDYIITQYENGLFDYGDKLTNAFESLYASVHEDQNFMTKYATTLASLDFFDAYVVEDFIKILEEDSVDKIIIEYFKNYASVLNKGILTITERAQTKTKDAQEKIDKMAQAVTTGLDSYDDLNEWIQGLQKIRDEIEKVGKAWTLGDISLTNTDLFIRQDGKFYATATAYRLRYQRTLEDLQKEQRLYTEMLDVATRTSGYVNSLDTYATENSFKTLITSLKGYNTDALVQYADSIWNLWQEVIAEAEGLTSFTDEAGNTIDKDTYISQEFQKRYQALISSMQGVILQDQLELLTKDEILKAIRWEDLLGDRNNNQLKDSIKNALGAAGFTSQQITEFITNLLIGGEAGVKALEDIFKDSGIIITSEQRQKAYRAAIDPLVSIFDSIDSFFVGSYVSDDVANIIKEYGFGNVTNNVIEAIDLTGQEYINFLQAIINSGESTQEEIAKATDAILKQGTAKYDFASDIIGGMDWSEIVNKIGEEQAKQFLGYFSVDETTGKIYAANATVYQEMLRALGIAGQQAINLIKEFNSKAIETTNTINSNIESELNSLSSAKTGDLIDLRQVYEIIGNIESEEGKFGKTGVALITGSTYGFLKDVADKLEAAEGVEDSQIRKLKDTMNSMLTNYVSFIAQGINGTLSNEDFANLWRNFSALGVDTENIQAFKTAQGIQFTQGSLISIYGQMRESNALLTQQLESDLIPQWTKSGEQCENIEGTLVRIVQLQRELTTASAEKNKQLQNELSLTKAILAEQLKTPDSFNFMDRNLPTGMQNAVNWWNSGVKGYSAINAAKSSGYMDIEAYYNIITTMANLVEQSDSEIEYLGMTAGNAWSRAAELITAGMSSITAIDGEEAKISMAKLGEAISDGAFDMSKGYDEAIKEMARANIDMLDAQIKMLQGIVAMEDLGELINDGEPLELDKLFKFDENGVVTLEKSFTDAQDKFKALKEETKEYLKTIYLDFGDNGVYSIVELFEADASTWQDLGKDAAQQFIDFWNIALSKGWSTENIQAQLAGAGITNKDGLKFNREAVTQLMSLATTGEIISTSFGDVAAEKIESLSTILNGALDRLATILSGNSNENGTSYFKSPAREWNPGDEEEAASTNTWPTLSNAEITKMRTELAKAQAAAESAQAQVAELTIQLEQNSANSTTEINELKTDIAAAQASADEAWARVNELERQLNVASSSRPTATTISNRGDSSALEDLQNEYEDALKTIKDLETIINDSSVQISTIIIEKERLDQECKTLNEKLSQALSTNQTNSELITSLEQELSIKNAELETKEAQIAALQEKLNTEIQLRTELEGSEQRLKEQLGNISNNDPKVADLTEQLHSVEIERDNLKFNNDQLNAAVDEAWNAYDEVNDALTAARAYISTLLKEKINAKSAEVILQADRQTADYGREQRAIEEEQLRYATQQKIAQDSVNQMLAADARTAEYGREQQDLLSEQVYAAFLAERDNAYREAEEERRRWEEEQQTKNNSIAYDANIITETDQRVAEAQREAAEAMANVLANAQEHAEAREKYSSYKTSKEDLEELLKKYFDVLLEIETLSEAGDLHDDYYENGEMNEEEYKNIKNYIQSLLQSSYSELETLTADLDHYNISIEELQVQYGESTKAITIQQKALKFLEQTVKNFKDQTSSLNNKLISVSSNWSKAGIAASNAAKTAKDAYTTIVNEGLNRLENLAPLTSSSDKTKKVISGDTGAKGNALAAGRTLMGELGPELWVSNGHYYVAGQNGAEFVNLPSDAIVFNHQQTADLFKRGYATRGKPVTNESNAIARAQGQGPAKASARQTLATLVAIRAQWEALFNAGARDLGSLAGRGGGGGGGGGKDWQPKTTTGDIQRWYNLLRQIAKIEEQITYQETLQSKLESDKVARGQELYDSYKKQMELLDAEIRRNNYLAEIQKSWYDMKREELARSDYGRIFTYDEEGLQQYVGNSMPGSGLGLDILENLNRRDIYGKAIENAATAEAQLRYLQSVGFNTDNLKYNEDGTVIDTSKLSGEELADAYVSMMENFWTTVDNWRDELDNLYDSYHEQQEKLIQNQNKQNELIQKMIDNQISLENKVLDAITDLRQKAIDELQDQRDAIDKAAQQYIDGLNDQLGKERDMYQNQQNADELLKLQRQLAILQRSGGSASQIRNLQNQIDSKMRDEYFDKQQEQIEAIQEASDKQLERLDHQIELMTETLAYQKENGLLWQDVYVVMQRSPSEIADFVAVNDKELQAKSALQWEEDTRKTLEEAQIYRAYAQEANEHTWEQTTDFSFEMEERLNELIDTTAKGNSDIVSAVVTGKSSGGGGSGGSGGSGSGTSGKTTTATTKIDTKEPQADALLNSNEAFEATKRVVTKNINEMMRLAMGDVTSSKETLTAGKRAEIIKSITDLGNKVIKNLDNAKDTSNLITRESLFKTTLLNLLKSYGSKYERLAAFSSGGLVDFTGPAMVHGSKTRPESIFSAEDTAFLRNELLNNIKTLPSIVNGFKTILGNYANANTYNSISGGSNIEHAEVNMYVQSIANDYDARRAGEQALDAIVRISRKNGPTSVSRR